MKAHNTLVNAIDGVGGYGAPEIATAGRDGNFILFLINNKCIEKFSAIQID